jgi:hypothetical protein
MKATTGKPSPGQQENYKKSKMPKTYVPTMFHSPLPAPVQLVDKGIYTSLPTTKTISTILPVAAPSIAIGKTIVPSIQTTDVLLDSFGKGKGKGKVDTGKGSYKKLDKGKGKGKGSLER